MAHVESPIIDRRQPIVSFRMTPYRTINLFRWLFLSFSFVMGMRVGAYLFDSLWIGAVAGLVIGLLVVLVDRLMKGFSLRLFSVATLGLLLGLAVTRLFFASDVLRYADEETRWVASLLLYSVFGYLGIMLAIRSSRDEFALIIPYIRFRRDALHDIPVVIDTSVLIDGRLLEVCDTGFVGTSFVVPHFVLKELQALGDSADPLKRERGRRGLELLQEARRRRDLSVTILEPALDEDHEGSVDQRLIRVARVVNTRLLTNDTGLTHLARLEGVSVLNLNELAHAMRAIVATGEQLEITLVKPGRDPHQAVGYLQDGSMVVVNNARALLGQRVEVSIGNAIQTGAGKMFFGELVRPALSPKIAGTAEMQETPETVAP